MVQTEAREYTPVQPSARFSQLQRADRLWDGLGDALMQGPLEIGDPLDPTKCLPLTVENIRLLRRVRETMKKDLGL